MSKTMSPIKTPVDENSTEYPRTGRVPGKSSQSEVVVHETVAENFKASNVQSVRSTQIVIKLSCYLLKKVNEMWMSSSIIILLASTDANHRRREQQMQMLENVAQNWKELKTLASRARTQLHKNRNLLQCPTEDNFRRRSNWVCERLCLFIVGY